MRAKLDSVDRTASMAEVMLHNEIERRLQRKGNRPFTSGGSWAVKNRQCPSGVDAV